AGSGRSPIGDSERPNRDEERLERLLLGLRTSSGVPEGWVSPAVLDEVEGQGLGSRRAGRFVLGDVGLLVANEVVLAAERYRGSGP
ncbi:MAG TPA: hypothetical protein VEA19_03860, partial [Actinomycetota bacterium]|nr:hypothetical protein [Actinomycetota bacterium]